MVRNKTLLYLLENMCVLAFGHPVLLSEQAYSYVRKAISVLIFLQLKDANESQYF